MSHLATSMIGCARRAQLQRISHTPHVIVCCCTPQPHTQRCLSTTTPKLRPGPPPWVTQLQESPLILSDPDGGIRMPKLPPHERERTLKARKFFKTDYKFMYSAEALEHHTINENEVPEILVCGASNVGKSTLMNTLLQRSDAARVSPKPGKTTLMNAYGIGPPLNKPLTKTSPRHGLILMDTPGYGFRSQQSWGKNIVDYLEKRKALRGALVLMAMGKKLSEQDKWMLRQLVRSSIRTTVVLTKIDKYKATWAEQAVEQARAVRKEVDFLEQSMGTKLQIDIYLASSMQTGTAAAVGIGGGIGGLRLNMLDMANISVADEGVQIAKENVQYTGEVISFDDIVYKA